MLEHQKDLGDLGNEQDVLDAEFDGLMQTDEAVAVGNPSVEPTLYTTWVTMSMQAESQPFNVVVQDIMRRCPTLATEDMEFFETLMTRSDENKNILVAMYFRFIQPVAWCDKPLLTTGALSTTHLHTRTLAQHCTHE
jgi:hypothetical protein